jgi:hypothetical protein
MCSNSQPSMQAFNTCELRVSFQQNCIIAGHDDAMALLLAGHHPNVQLLGVSTVASNQVTNLNPSPAGAHQGSAQALVHVQQQHNVALLHASQSLVRQGTACVAG